MSNNTNNTINTNTNNTNNTINQLYRRKTTMADPTIKHHFNEFGKYCLKNNFIKIHPNKDITVRGRRYDAALILSSIDLKDKVVCEVGARDSILSSYITGIAKEVHAMDYFEEWNKGTLNDLGQTDYWFPLWSNAAINPEKIFCTNGNILDMTTLYKDNMFDVIIGLSVLPYLFKQHKSKTDEYDGDIIGISEIVRVCKPGGIIILSFCMALIDADVMGTHVYCLKTFFERIIKDAANCCKIYGACDYDMSNPLNDSIYNIGDFYPVSDGIIFLKKIE